jgi:hypothetical protein
VRTSRKWGKGRESLLAKGHAVSPSVPHSAHRSARADTIGGAVTPRSAIPDIVESTIVESAMRLKAVTRPAMILNAVSVSCCVVERNESWTIFHSNHMVKSSTSLRRFANMRATRLGTRRLMID